MVNAATFYLLWLVAAAALVLAVPVLGVLTVAGGLAIVTRNRQGS
ncbi:hypothetical protein [Qaidamihabitans albus]|nr:hypothetical protein [Qaidamihabitans albus]